MLNTEDATDVFPSGTEDVGSAEPDRQTRWAFWTFVVYLAGALPFLLWKGSYRWFFGDEWSFLANRSISVDGLFRPHNQQHWVTIPVLVYRGLYSLVGLHAYWPYQLVVIVLHLTTAALLRVAMRRAGVRPWIATIGAGTFVLLGAAEDNILWAFQVGFVGALVAGLTQLILADHDGPIDRRDWLGLGAGFVGLMMSGQAPPLIIGVGIVCLFRRRWAAAAFHTVPLGLTYIVWSRLEHVRAVLTVEGHPFTATDYVKWMNSAATGLFTALGHFWLLALLLAGVLIGGTVVALRSEGGAFFRRASVPTALLVSCVVSMSVAAPSRFFSGPEMARAGRYIGVMAALTLPALAVAADAIARRWPRATPAVLVLMLVPIPFNATTFASDPVLTRGYYESLRANTLGLLELPATSRVPPWVRPNETILGQPDMTVGWLLGARDEGKLPPPTQLTPVGARIAPIQLGVARTTETLPTDRACTTSHDPVAIDPGVGDRLLFGTAVGIAGRFGDKAATPSVQLQSGVAQVTLPDLHLLVGPAIGADEFELCR